MACEVLSLFLSQKLRLHEELGIVLDANVYLTGTHNI